MRPALGDEDELARTHRPLPDRYLTVRDRISAPAALAALAALAARAALSTLTAKEAEPVAGADLGEQVRLGGAAVLLVQRDCLLVAPGGDVSRTRRERLLSPRAGAAFAPPWAHLVGPRCLSRIESTLSVSRKLFVPWSTLGGGVAEVWGRRGEARGFVHRHPKAGPLRVPVQAGGGVRRAEEEGGVDRPEARE